MSISTAHNKDSAEISEMMKTLGGITEDDLEILARRTKNLFASAGNKDDHIVDVNKKAEREG